MTKHKGGLKCPSCGQPTMTKMEMVQDILRWTGQKIKSKFSNAEFTSEELFWVWKTLKEKHGSTN